MYIKQKEVKHSFEKKEQLIPMVLYSGEDLICLAMYSTTNQDTLPTGKGAVKIVFQKVLRLQHCLLPSVLVRNVHITFLASTLSYVSTVNGNTNYVYKGAVLKI